MDNGTGLSRLAVGVHTAAAETGGHRSIFTVRKWDLDQIGWTLRRDYDSLRLISPGREPDQRHFDEYRCAPSGTYTAENTNFVLDAGWQMMMNGIAGAAVTKFASGTVGRIGAGTSSTAPAYTQTDLQASTGATTRQWEMLNAVPVVGATHSAGITFAAQFPTTDANFAWAEFGIDSGTAAGTGAAVAPMLERGTASPGTKTSAQTWNATIAITWT